MKKRNAYCPSCNTRITFEEAPCRGQQLGCPECREQLEVVTLLPLKLDWAFDEIDQFASNDYVDWVMQVEEFSDGWA